MSQEIDYGVVLADLEAKRAALDAAIAGVRQILGQPTESRPERATGPLAPEPLPEAVTPGVFHGLSIAEAAKKYLQMTKTKQKTSAICKALKAGGIETSAKSFYGNVFTALTRNKEFIKMGKYWALTEWHPTHALAAASKRSKPKRRAGRNRAPKGGNTRNRPKADAPVGSDRNLERAAS